MQTLVNVETLIPSDHRFFQNPVLKLVLQKIRKIKRRFRKTILIKIINHMMHGGTQLRLHKNRCRSRWLCPASLSRSLGGMGAIPGKMPRLMANKALLLGGLVLLSAILGGGCGRTLVLALILLLVTLVSFAVLAFLIPLALAFAVFVFPFLFPFVVLSFVLSFVVLSSPVKTILVLLKLKWVGMLTLPRPILEIQYAKIGVVKAQCRFKLAKAIYLRVEQDIFLGLYTQVPKHDHTAICLSEGKIGKPCSEPLVLGKLNLDTPENFQGSVGYPLRCRELQDLLPP